MPQNNELYHTCMVQMCRFLPEASEREDKVAPLAVPQLGSCGPSGRAWQLWAARHSQSEAPATDGATDGLSCSR